MRISSTKNNRPVGKWISIVLVVGLICAVVLALKGKLGEVQQEKAKVDQSELTVAAFEGSTFNIALSSDAFKKLSAKRDEAMKRGLLFTSKDDLVDADIKIDGKEYPCKLRLKGDLLDHLVGNRWSFRIILKAGQEWNGMNTFSIHNSKARSHTAEWLMHELFRKEGILVPDYDFIKVQLNGKELGVYAFEHHFENQMLVKNNREIGPILKHNDDAYWENVHKKLNPFPWIEASQIELFNKQNENDPAFVKSFDIAHSMLNAFVNEQKSPTEVFDLELMAKYFALLDLSHAWHAAQFTNIRFYLNNFSGKLEPIAFDCFGDHLPNVNSDWEAYGEAFNDRTSKDAAYARSDVYRYLMFQDESFYELYMKALNQFTDPDYLNKFKGEYDGALASRVAFIQADDQYKDWKPDWETIFGKAFFTRKKLDAKPNMALKAFRVNGAANEISLESYHYFPLEVLGFGDELEMNVPLDKPLFIEAFNKLVPVKKYGYKQNDEIEYIYFRTLGLSNVHKIKVAKSNAPNENVAVQHFNLSKFTALPFVNQVAQDINVSSGRHVLDFPVAIPAGYTLRIAAGAELQFEKDGSLLSKSKIIAEGSAANPIKIFAQAQEGTSILLSEVSDKSIFNHCQFIGLNDFQEQNLRAKGAVNIYKSAADFNHCQFRDVKSAEVLSIRNSQVNVQNSIFKNCVGSAIKAKYSSVDVKSTNFEIIGKNGISVEKGSLNIAESNFREVLNRAMDFSDHVEVYGWSNNIFDSYQSLFVSNAANVKLIKFWNENITRGFELRGQIKNKPTLDIEQFNFKNIETLYLIEQGFSIMVNGKREMG